MKFSKNHKFAHSIVVGFLLFSTAVFSAELKIYDLQSEDFYVRTEKDSIIGFFHYFRGKNPYKIIFFSTSGEKPELYSLRFDLQGNFKEDGKATFATAENMAILAWKQGSFIPPLKGAANAGDQAYFYLQMTKIKSWLSADKEKYFNLAVEHGVPQLVEWLCAMGADVNRTNLQEDKQTYLHRAAFRNDLEMARVLIKYKANVKVWNVQLETALHYAAFADSGIAELLLDRGADIEAKNFADQTPIFNAVFNAAPKNVELFIRRKANLNAKDDQGMSVYQHAKLLFETKGHKSRGEIFEMLKKAGAKP